MINSNFTPKGLPLGDNSTNMTYLYGVSDFFSVMFENTETVNLLLESTSETAADIYSRFLQLTSSLSLADIQTTIGSTIRLVVVRNTDTVAGLVNTFKLPINVVYSKYIANKPLLPTTLLENNVDYRIDPQLDGSYNLVLSKGIDGMGFPIRTLADGTTKEYAFWFVDVEVDEQLISKHFAALIGVSPQSSTDLFKNFVYGLYYMYSQGPTLGLIRKGLNLALGIPLARGSETVLSIRPYLETDQYIVITDQNQYVIPYGIYPIVTVGQALSVSDELAQWVEVKDWTDGGEWWINLAIPSSIVPALPDNQLNRYATRGSSLEYIMRTYLKTNTFLVNIKVANFKDNQVFQQLAGIINRIKPAYTNAIYIWTIPYLEEVIHVNDDSLSQRRDIKSCENITYPIHRLRRDLPDGERLFRSCPTFLRMNVHPVVNKMMGEGVANKLSVPIDNTIATGYVNPQHQYRTNTDYENAWLNTLATRGQESGRLPRSKIGFFRGHDTTYGNIVHKSFSSLTSPDMRVIPMYILTERALQAKCLTVGISPPAPTDWMFNLFNTNGMSGAINTSAINEGLPTIDVFNKMTTFYTTLFSRSPLEMPVNPFLPKLGERLWTPQYKTDIILGDFIIGARIIDNLIGLYYVTKNLSLDAPYFDMVPGNDSLAMTITGPMMRGLGPTSSPMYLTRGRGNLNYNNVSTEVNANTIDSTLDSPVINNQYSDNFNTTPTQLTRGTPVSLRQIMNA